MRVPWPLPPITAYTAQPSCNCIAIAVRCWLSYGGTAMSKRVDTRLSVREQLREAGLRATSARIAVMLCLLESKGPLTHAEVYERIKGNGFDRATAYRNLKDLVEARFLHRHDLGDHVWRFELVQAESKTSPGHSPSAHPHFLCSDCGSVECLPPSIVALQGVRGVPKSLRRFRELEIQIRGVCDACA